MGALIKVLGTGHNFLGSKDVAVITTPYRAAVGPNRPGLIWMRNP
jgi:hypothetical protein